MMDANSDGMISKDEYISYHDQAYGKWNKPTSL
jgi:hypothetical protein